MRKLFFLIVLVAMLSGCSPWIGLHKVELGMTKPEVMQQMGDYQNSLETMYAAAIEGLEWGANQASLYGFGELPMGEDRLTIVEQLTDQLVAIDPLARRLPVPAGRNLRHGDVGAQFGGFVVLLHGAILPAMRCRTSCRRFRK